jgi:hypothetical protein
MSRQNPKLILIIAFVLLLLGVIFPLLIILKMLPSTFFLNFLAYGFSVVGLFLGTLGIIMARQPVKR